MTIKEEQIEKIEKTLGMKFDKTTVDYLLDKPYIFVGVYLEKMIDPYCIKLALSEGTYLDSEQPERWSPNPKMVYGEPYRETVFRFSRETFLPRFIEIYSKLKQVGFRVREVR